MPGKGSFGSVKRSHEGTFPTPVCRCLQQLSLLALIAGDELKSLRILPFVLLETGVCEFPSFIFSFDGIQDFVSPFHH